MSSVALPPASDSMPAFASPGQCLAPVPPSDQVAGWIAFSLVFHDLSGDVAATSTAVARIDGGADHFAAGHAFDSVRVVALRELGFGTAELPPARYRHWYVVGHAASLGDVTRTTMAVAFAPAIVVRPELEAA